MERQLLERMVGAGVLIIALVVIGPVILDGNQPEDSGPGTPEPSATELQTHTVRLNGPAPAARPAGVPPSGQQASPAPAPPAPAVTTVEPKPAASLAVAGSPPLTKEGAAPIASVAEHAEPAKPAATPAEPRASLPAEARSGWFVQVGTFGQRDNAERLVTNLKGLGFAAVVNTTDRSGKALHRVRVGPAGGRAEAEALAARLAAAGHRGQIVAP
jgi:DedD protein